MILAQALAASYRAEEALQLLDKLDPESGALPGKTSYFGGLLLVLHDLGDAARLEREAARVERLFGELSASNFRDIAAAIRGGTAVDTAMARILRSWSEPADVVLTAAIRVVRDLRAHGHDQDANRGMQQVVAHADSARTTLLTTWSGANALGIVFVDANRWNDAEALLDTMRVLAHTTYDQFDYVTWRAAIKAHAGKRDAAFAELRELDRLRAQMPASQRQKYFRGGDDYAYFRAAWLMLLGKQSEAVPILRPLVEKDGPAFTWHTDPLYPLIRDTPSLLQLLVPRK